MCGTGTTAHHKQLNYMNKTVVYDYKGSQISFISGENVMVNATEMAKSFGKRPVDWLKYQQSQDYINALAEVRNVTSADLVRVTKGGNDKKLQGTWMHEDVALEFARWLNPAFAIWCNDRIKELLKTGVTTVSNDDEAIAYAMQVLNKRLEQTRQEKAILEQQAEQQQAMIDLQDREIKQSAPKVKYYDDCLQSVNTLTTTQVAKQIGLDAEKLHRKLKEIGVIYRQSGQWLLHSPYSTWGLHATRTQTYTRSDGSTGTSIYTVWTEKGRRFIIALYQEGFDLKRAIKQL